MTVSFNQIPLAQNEILQINTGKLVMSVPDQIAAFTRCIASLPDRVMLVKVRGMDRPFLLRVHHVEDPYVQKKMLVCREWREVKLKQFVALIRKAHPWYFLPCEEEPDEPLVVTQESKRRKRRVEESPMS